MTSRRRVLGAVPAILAGCVDTRSGGTERPPTDGETDEPPTDGETGGTPTECDQSTPEPTPDLSVENRRSASVTVTVTVTRDGTATAADPAFEETVTVDPGASEDRFDVFPTEATYLVRAELEDGSTASETLDVTPGDRRSLVAVTIADDVDVGILNVVPGPTPVPCDLRRQSL